MRRAAFLALALVVVAGAVPATAQESRFSAAVIAGAQNNSGYKLEPDTSIIGFQLGVNLDANWALQLETTFSNPEINRPLGVTLPPVRGAVETTDMVMVAGNVVHFFPSKASRFLPFVTAGVTWVDINYNNPELFPGKDGVGWGLNLGTGFRYGLASHSFLLGELRWHSIGKPNFQALQGIIGFGFGIGKP
jgi:hypothetical protein